MKRILLVADGGGKLGWGHAMRTLAVAHAIKDRANVALRWATSTPSAIRGLDPPCPVLAYKHTGLNLDGLVEDVDAALIDLRFPLRDYGLGAWYMVDHGTGLDGTNRICPHFGAENRDWGAGSVCTGPRWMPLRREVVLGPEWSYNHKAPVLTYKLPPGTVLPNNTAGIEEIEEHARWFERSWWFAIVPPSTIAYELMAVGVPVLLVDPPHDQPKDIGQAMVDAGVADWWHTEMWVCGAYDFQAQVDAVGIDGRGADRIADLLTEGT